MFCVWIADGEKRESELLCVGVRKAAALLSDEDFTCESATVTAHFTPLVEKNILPDMACLDLSLPEGLGFAHALRRQSISLFMVVVAGQDLSPMTYLHPSVLAGSLLLRPFTAPQAEQVLHEALAFCVRTRVGTPDSLFWVETRAGRESVRYTDILYFESLGKRISLVTGVREYQFADTMEHLAAILPNAFVRCHRGFIVRRDRIDKIQFSKNSILLDNGEEVPLSRSYKIALKGDAK